MCSVRKLKLPLTIDSLPNILISSPVDCKNNYNHQARCLLEPAKRSNEYISWNQCILISISLKTTRKKGSAGKNLGVFSPRYSSNYTLNKKCNSNMGREFFSKIRVLILIFKKDQGRPTTPSPPSCVPVIHNDYLKLCCLLTLLFIFVLLFEL